MQDTQHKRRYFTKAQISRVLKQPRSPDWRGACPPLPYLFCGLFVPQKLNNVKVWGVI